MIEMVSYVPHIVRWCPAFLACYRDIGARSSAITGGAHGLYSWIMAWTPRR